MESDKRKIFQVFVPGILQTSLHLDGITVWPPPQDVYATIQKVPVLKKVLHIQPKEHIDDWVENFISKNVTPGKFLPPFTDFEKFLLRPNHAIFSYDWRMSQRIVAKNLLAFINDLDISSEFDIELIGFSLGGCIAFIALAEAQMLQLSFISKVVRLVTIGSPLKGSISATTAILGINDQLSNPNIMNIIHQDNFAPIYELITSSPHIYFFNEDGRPLKKKEFKALFTSNPAINTKKLEKAFEFKKYYGGLKLANVEIVCYRGLEYGSQNICKCVVKKDGTIIPFYETNNSDGRISLYEATPFDDHNYMIRAVAANHSTLLESEELAAHLFDNNNLSELRVQIVDTTNTTISFMLYTQTPNEILPLKKMVAKKISLLYKNTNIDITSNIKQRKKDVWISIPSKYESGCLMFENISYSYMKDEIKIKVVKNRIITSFDLLNPNIFY